jgi:monoamine oxidase
MKITHPICIVGAGLSGLTLAYLLAQKNIKSIILEASSRLGGRIQTLQGQNETPLELGATWFSEAHPHLLNLLQELDLKKYPQFSHGKSLFQTKSFEPTQTFFVPESESPSYRIAGGTQQVIEKLSQTNSNIQIQLNSQVIAIQELEHELLLNLSNGQQIIAGQVILCLPPQLVHAKIAFSPSLPSDLWNLLPSVQTWMSGSIKFVLEYDSHFWRDNGYSGMLYSHSGIITEMYDHTNFEKNKFGFTGFLNSGAAAYSQEVRKELVLQQLSQLLGNEVLNLKLYQDKVWVNEFVYEGSQIIRRPHQNNGHPMLQASYLDGKLHFAGTEVATEFSGYMEGAIISAQKLAKRFEN